MVLVNLYKASFYRKLIFCLSLVFNYFSHAANLAVFESDFYPSRMKCGRSKQIFNRSVSDVSRPLIFLQDNSDF